MARIAALREEIRRLELDVKKTQGAIRELDRMAERYMALAQRLGLPENIENAIHQAMRLKIALEAMYRSALMLQAASGPIGLATALAGIGISSIMLADSMETRRPRY